MNLTTLTYQVEAVCREAGTFINHEKKKVSGRDIEIKGLNSLVSYVDKNAEAILVKGLRSILPEAGFITEEDTPDDADKPLRWVIDPLDGTTNYLHGIPVYAVSVALLQGDEELIGVVYELGQEEMFTSSKGGGAFLNGDLLRMDGVKQLSDTLIATGFPYHDFSRMDPYMRLLRDLFQKTRGVRRLGSAATDLAYVACGRFDAFFEAGLSPWDVAGGSLLVKEAGGVVTDFEGDSGYIFGAEIVATSGAVYQEFIDLVKKHFNKMIKHLYLISGMGAGEDIFRNLDLGAVETHFIPWEKVSMAESFTDYVKRLSAHIDATEEFGILGVSLGGITAQEMTRYVKPSLLILISTIKNHDELPPYLRIAASANLQKIFPDQFYKWAAMHSGAVIGLHGKEDMALFHDMISRYGDDYYKWCINAVAEWQGVKHKVPYLQLHGDSDIVFPSAFIKDADIVKGGTHFMVMTQAAEVSRKIREFLEELETRNNN